MDKVKQNTNRLNYLLSLYKMTGDELLHTINNGLKKPLSQDDIFSDSINVSSLKKIDKIFNKGLHFYLDPAPIVASTDASIFFRKTEFGTELNIGSKKIVNQFEELKISLSAIAKLSDIHLNRILPVYTIQADPRLVAFEIRKDIYPKFNADKKEFLKSLIASLASKHILVFEYIEKSNKKEKSNIDGFFLNPNVIVLKRNYFSREIFTLAHEVGHFLLNEEEVEKIDDDNFTNTKLSAIERWCNDFAYYFLAGNYSDIIDQLSTANASNDYHNSEIHDISTKTNLSLLALYTRLLFQEKISAFDYKCVKKDLDEKYNRDQEQKKSDRELAKEEGRAQKVHTAVPIKSPLFVSTLQAALYDGVVSEYQVCKTLNISSDKLGKLIQ